MRGDASNWKPGSLGRMSPEPTAHRPDSQREHDLENGLGRMPKAGKEALQDMQSRGSGRSHLLFG